MNFLKVKKFVFVFLFLFFISCGFVNAKTLTGQVYFEKSGRSSEYRHSINLFEETKEYSPFIELIYNQGFYLGQYLDSYFSLDNSEFFNEKYLYSISLFSKNDLNYLKSEYYSSPSGPVTDYSDGKYIDFLSSSMTFIDDNTIDNASYFIMFGTYDTNAIVYEDYFYLNLYARYVFAIDSSGVPIGYYVLGSNDTYSANSSGYNTIYRFSFPFDDLSVPDITSWYSYLYYHTGTSALSSTEYDKIYPKYFYFDEENHTTSDNSGYTSLQNFWNFVSSGFNDFQIDFTRWNMQFVYDDVFYKKGINFVPLMKRWYSTTSYVVPDNYSMINISDSEKGYYLDFKYNSCSKKDYILYYSSDSYLDRHKLYFTYYSYLLNDDSNYVFDFYKSFYTYSGKSYSVYSYDPLLDLAVTIDDLQNYVVNLTQSSLVIDYKVYYNPSCYDVHNGNSTSMTFNFPNGSHTLNSNDLNDNFLNNNTTQYYVNSNVSSNNSSASSNPDVLNLDVNEIIKNIPNYVSGFIVSIGALVNVAYAFLFGLPPEIFGFLFSIFIVGAVIIVIKLVRGG